MDEAEEEEETKEVKEKEKTSGNILVVETDFERMPRRSSFRSKERRELTRYLPPVYQTSNWKTWRWKRTNIWLLNSNVSIIAFDNNIFGRGASIQFDEKPANVIVNDDSSTDATGAESDCKEEEEEPEKESGNSEEWVFKWL